MKIKYLWYRQSSSLRVLAVFLGYHSAGFILVSQVSGLGPNHWNLWKVGDAAGFLFMTFCTPWDVSGFASHGRRTRVEVRRAILRGIIAPPPRGTRALWDDWQVGGTRRSHAQRVPGDSRGRQAGVWAESPRCPRLVTLAVHPQGKVISLYSDPWDRISSFHDNQAAKLLEFDLSEATQSFVFCRHSAECLLLCPPAWWPEALILTLLHLGFHIRKPGQ